MSIYIKLSNYIFCVIKIIVSPHCHSLPWLSSSRVKPDIRCRSSCVAHALPRALCCKWGLVDKGRRESLSSMRVPWLHACPEERGREKNRNPSKEDLPPVKLDVRRLNSSRSSVYRRSTPTWQEAIQCKSRADTSRPRVAARLRSGTSLIRVRAFVHSASWMQHRWKTGVSFPSSFLPLPTPRRLRSFQPWTTNTRNYSYSYSFHSGSSVCVSMCVCKFGFVAVATWAD